MTEPIQQLHTATGYSHEDYLRAAITLWGEAGCYAVTEYQRLDEWLFDGELPPLPIVIGLTAYGKCLGLTRPEGSWDVGLPRISLAPVIFTGNHRTPGGRKHVTDVITHEMTHARLILDGLDSSHNGRPWCDLIGRLSPRVLGHTITAAPVNPRRVDGRVVRRPRDGHLERSVIARWPYSLRPPDWDHGERIYVESY